MMKSNGPRTEPWGDTALQEDMCQEDGLFSRLTRKQRDDRYDLIRTSSEQSHGYQTRRRGG